MTPAHVDCPACPVVADFTLAHLRALTDASALRECIDAPVPTAMLRDVLDALARQTALATIHREERDVCAAEGYRLTQALDAAQRSAAQSAAAAVDAARDLGHVVATERARADAAEGECARLRAAVGQVRQRAREAAQMLIAEVGTDGPMDVGDAARRAVAYIGRITADRDAAVAQREALAGAVRRERATRAAWLATLPPCATAPAEVLAAEAATGRALDALLTGGAP